jgi:hypothetical protein
MVSRGHQEEGDDELDLRAGAGSFLARMAGESKAGVAGLRRQRVGQRGAVAASALERCNQ